MIEPRSDMLPDKSETNQEEEVTTKPNINDIDETIEPVEEAPKVEAPEEVKVPEGYVPHGALHEERAKRKKAEQDIRDLEAKLKETSARDDDEIVSDEGRIIMDKIKSLTDKINSKDRQEEETKVFKDFPILNERKDEFEEYCEENPDLSPAKAAKLFLFDNDLIAKAKTERKGLAKPSGGAKKTTPDGISVEDVKRLRDESPRKYQRLIQSGKLDPDKIGI